MKIIFPLLAISLFVNACNNRGETGTESKARQELKKQRFFPVTAYLEGEINNIKQAGVNPLKFTTINNQTDSVWLKIEELDTVLQEFLKPKIDSANLITLFSEKSFLDQTINAITLTYDPAGNLPDSFTLKHWDVYINPETGTVKTIYLLKEPDKNKTLQLTWVSNKWCKITSIVTDETGNSKVEKEEKITWDF